MKEMDSSSLGTIYTLNKRGSALLIKNINVASRENVYFSTNRSF